MAQDADDLVNRLAVAREQVAPAVPDIDPGDLLLILQSLLRPPGSGRLYFVRELRPGVYVY